MIQLKTVAFYICDNCKIEVQGAKWDFGTTSTLPNGWSKTHIALEEKRNTVEKVIHTCSAKCLLTVEKSPGDFF